MTGCSPLRCLRALSTSSRSKWRLRRSCLFAAPMPSGAEHSDAAAIRILEKQLFAARMPSGVEHKELADECLFYNPVVRRSAASAR